MGILFLIYINLVIPNYELRQDAHIIQNIISKSDDNSFFGVFGESNKRLTFIELSNNNITNKRHALLFKNQHTEVFVNKHIDSLAIIYAIKINVKNQDVLLVDKVIFFEY